MRKRIVFSVKYDTFIDVPDDFTRDQIVEQAQEEIIIPKGKSNSLHGIPPVIHRDGLKVVRVSTMQPDEDLFGNKT